jgi:hypothetical protein
MSGFCKNCRYWIPPNKTDYAESVQAMGYGECDLLSQADLDKHERPVAFLELENMSFACKGEFGCNQFVEGEYEE